MRLKTFAMFVGLVAFLSAAQDARAGAIRYTGQQIRRGTVAVAQTTSDAAQAAGGSVATAGKATGSTAKNGAVAVGKGAKATPGLVARGTSAAAKGLAKAIW